MVRFKIYLIFLSIFLIFFNNPSSAEEYILAIVNDEVITSKDLKDFLNFMRLQYAERRVQIQPEQDLEKMKAELLKKLIEDRLILQEAKRQKINIDKNFLFAKIKEIKKKYPTDKDFQEALNAQGLTLADIEKRIEEQMLIYNAIEKNIKTKIIIHPQEVNLFYEQHKEEFVEPEKREVFVIVFDDELEAQNLREKLKKERLDALLKDPSLNVKQLGKLEKGQLKKEFDEIVFKLEEGQPSEILKMDEKHYIFFVKKIIPSYQMSFSEVKDRIYNLLFEKKMDEELNRWLDELRKKSYIQIKQN
jgi:parvulin-like peptidyl-prolyl isomerase